ncbi:hypothetical protein STEG23_018071 [Scotinomys teguina]
MVGLYSSSLESVPVPSESGLYPDPIVTMPESKRSYRSCFHNAVTGASFISIITRMNEIPDAGSSDSLNTCTYLKSEFKYTLGQTLTTCLVDTKCVRKDKCVIFKVLALHEVISNAVANLQNSGVLNLLFTFFLILHNFHKVNGY